MRHRAEDEHRRHSGVAWREKAESREQDEQPGQEQNQQGDRHGILGLFDQQPVLLRQQAEMAERLGLPPALSLVLGLQVEQFSLDFRKERADRPGANCMRGIVHRTVPPRLGAIAQ